LIKILSNKYLLLISRILLAGIFIVAGSLKISDPGGFGDAIENYRIFPTIMINLVAITLPWIELICGILLLLGIIVKENIIVINSLLLIFLVIIIAAVIRGLDIECGCFGTSDGAVVGIQKIIENFIMLLLGLQIYKFDKGDFSLNSLTNNDNLNESN
jgi:uncharacterized membrane protein YphA (DoxX/SURF4 family)